MRLETTCGMMPNQIEGELDDGRPFYFRARHGWWALHVGNIGQTVWDIVGDDSIVLQGDRPDAGWWTSARSELFCRAAIKRYLANGGITA